MQFFSQDDFLRRFASKYFALAFRHFYDNTSGSSWVDTSKPINIYKRTTDFLQFLQQFHSPHTVAQLLESDFLIPVEGLLLGQGLALQDAQVGHYLVTTLPKLHIVLMQLLLRAFWVCVIDSKPMNTEVLKLSRLLSFALIMSVNSPDEHSDHVLEFVIRFVLENCPSREKFVLFRAVLRRSELSNKYKAYLEAAETRLKPKEASNFIESFEEVPLKSCDKRQLQQVLRKEAKLTTQVVSQPSTSRQPPTKKVHRAPRTPERKVFKTPEKKASRSRRREDTSEKKPMRLVANRQVCQRTIFEIKNKKFIPKKIQYESTTASSCSNFTAPFESSMRGYLFKQIPEEQLQGVVAFATPVQKSKEVHPVFSVGPTPQLFPFTPKKHQERVDTTTARTTRAYR